MLLKNLLPYLGTLPLIAAVILLLNNLRLIPPFVTVEYMALSYAVVIASFMNGVLWGTALQQKTGVNLFIISNALTLITWVSFLALPFYATALVLCLVFLYLLAMDYKIRHHLTPDYLKTRRNVTVIVVGCLLTITVLIR